jgi:hypothetical protein
MPRAFAESALLLQAVQLPQVWYKKSPIFPVGWNFVRHPRASANRPLKHSSLIEREHNRYCSSHSLEIMKMTVTKSNSGVFSDWTFIN